MTRLYTNPVLIKGAPFEQQKLEKVSTLAVLHDKGLVGGVLKDTIQLSQAFAHQALHELDLALHSQEVLGLHLSLFVRLDDDGVTAQGAERLVYYRDAAATGCMSKAGTHSSSGRTHDAKNG